MAERQPVQRSSPARAAARRAFATPEQGGWLRLQRAAGNRATTRVLRKVQRTVTEGGTVYPDATATLAAVGPRLAGLDPLRLRAVIARFNHDNRVFADADALDAAATEGVAALAGAQVLVLWLDERLEARTAVGEQAYQFTMSYKHLRDTYRRGDREYGAANVANEEGNTVLTTGDGDVEARLQVLAEHVRADRLAAALAHPVALAPGTQFVVGGVTYVVEGGGGDFHVYPTAGATTLNLANAAYDGLVAFARWRRAPESVMARGGMLAHRPAIEAAAAAIGQITGVPDVAGVVAAAALAHAVARIRNEAAQIANGLAEQRLAVQALRAALDGHPPWNAALQRNIAEAAVVSAEAALGERAPVIEALGLGTLGDRVQAETVAVDDADVALGQARVALNALRLAVQTARNNYDGAVAEDAGGGEEEMGLGFFGGPDDD